MPYIEKSDKSYLEPLVESLMLEVGTVGELTYAISVMCDRFANKFRLNYAEIAHVMGALECTKHEFYRRVAVPYEESKKELNGDIFEDHTGPVRR